MATRALDESHWRHPQTVTIMAELPDTAVGPLAAKLPGLRSQLGLDQLPQLHFFRAFVLDVEHDLRGRPLPARVAVSLIFDGTLETLLNDWLVVALPAILEMFADCTDSPTGSSLRAWLKDHADRPATYHAGTLRHPLPQIRQEYQLRTAVESFVDGRMQDGYWRDRDPVRIREDIRRFVESRDDLPQGPRPAITWGSFALEQLDALKFAAILLLPPTLLAVLVVWLAGLSWWMVLPITVLIGALVVGLYMLIVRYHELFEGDLVVRPAEGQVTALLRDEDHCMQNQFTMITPVRDSWFRRTNLRLILWFANNVSKHWYRRGKLAGIDTIHFARFHQLDQGRRMLFMSDFDGGWDRYLYEFLGVGSLVVVPIWTNLHGCPKTVFLRWPDAGFEQRFLPFTRAYQRPSQIWYSAMDHLTVSEVLRNAQLRAGLYGNLSRSAIERWLQLI